MIIIRLDGGMGNQMFQYAMGRSLTYHLNTELKIDVSSYEDNSLREYNLFPFNIVENFVSLQDLQRVRKPYKNRRDALYNKLLGFILFEDEINYYDEKCFNYNPEILNLSDNTYLKGYWQSEKYFKDIEEVIRSEFQFKILPDLMNMKIGEKIMAQKSVSIHIRRGDYVTNQVHGLCNIDYYLKGIDYILQRIDKPHFYIFSDDPSWAKDNIKSDYPMDYISHNIEGNSYEDLRLMSFCKHHIIANSSFSWCGAWLSQNPQKIVIAPKKWFNVNIHNTNDLIPSSWIKL